ncbi:MAG: MarR family transcriptional regulator [Pseudomonadota bacterium]
METVGTTFATSDFPQQRYRDNFARHVLGVTLYMESTIMGRLRDNFGHSGLRLSFEPYMTMAARGDVRLSDMADMLAISRQAANQTANQIETAGYLRRSADSRDGRAKLLVATDQGMALIRDGAIEAERLENQLCELAGAGAIATAQASLLTLCEQLALLPRYQLELASELNLAALLPRLANWINNELMDLARDRGHPHLKPNFGQVLTAIGPDGGRIQQIARAQNVSKQAISTIVARLEALGYLERVSDPLDARQQVLHFTAYGRQLIRDAVASLDELRARLAGIIGDDALAQLEDTLAQLYRSLNPEGEVFTDASGDIGNLADDLLQQLGAQGAAALAEHLLLLTHAQRTTA